MKKILALLLLSIHTFCFATYHGQWAQDRYIHTNFFKGYKGGFFVDVGAHDGLSFSNTCFFEKEMGWTGICVEPIPSVFEQLKANRPNSNCIKGCVSNLPGEGLFFLIKGHTEMSSGLVDKYDLRHLHRAQNEAKQYGGHYEFMMVDCFLLSDILEKENITHVNYLNLDTVGGEYEILTTIDFSKFTIDVITVENTYNDPRYNTLLSEKGFVFVKNLGVDMIFVNKNFLREFLENNYSLDFDVSAEDLL